MSAISMCQVCPEKNKLEFLRILRSMFRPVLKNPRFAAWCLRSSTRKSQYVHLGIEPRLLHPKH